MGKGWIKIDRQILEWQWYSDINTCRLFLHLLLRANIVPGIHSGKRVGRGELLISFRNLAAESGLTFQNVRTCIERLISTGEIAVESTRRESIIIKILNFDKYQLGKKPKDVENKEVTTANTETNTGNNTAINTESNTARATINKGGNEGSQHRKPHSNQHSKQHSKQHTLKEYFKEKKKKKDKEKKTILTDSLQKEKENKPAVADLSVGATDPPVTPPEVEEARELNEADMRLRDFVKFWNRIMAKKAIKTITGIRGTRLVMFRARQKEYSQNEIYEAMQKLADSEFCNGDNSRGWTATFDWFVRPNNFPKVLEGNYDNRNNGKGKNQYRQSAADKEAEREEFFASIDQFLSGNLNAKN